MQDRTTDQVVVRAEKGWLLFEQLRSSHARTLILVTKVLIPPNPEAARVSETLVVSLLGRKDSNLRSRLQRPLPYRLATP